MASSTRHARRSTPVVAIDPRRASRSTVVTAPERRWRRSSRARSPRALPPAIDARAGATIADDLGGTRTRCSAEGAGWSDGVQAMRDGTPRCMIDYHRVVTCPYEVNKCVSDTAGGRWCIALSLGRRHGPADGLSRGLLGERLRRRRRVRRPVGPRHGPRVGLRRGRPRPDAPRSQRRRGVRPAACDGPGGAHPGPDRPRRGGPTRIESLESGRTASSPSPSPTRS